MARLALGLAGAAVGSFFGVPQFGFIAGSLLGAALFPDDPIKTEGPRLGDTAVSASTYGAAIPLGYGTMRIAGNMIWSSGIIERTETEERGGKGSFLGGGQEQTTYSYFASFTFAFAQRESEEVIRIWADSKIIHDKSDQSTVNVEGLNFRFYKGTETQLPDPSMEADKGVGNIPGHRGLVYIVFDDLPLGPYGNRIPNITAEIAFKAETTNTIRFSTDISTLTTDVTTSNLAVDRKRRRIYSVDVATDIVRIWNYDTLQEIRQVSVGSNFSTVGGPLFVGEFTGNILHRPGAANFESINKINPETFAVEQAIGSVSAIKQIIEAPAIGVDLIGLPKLKPLLFAWHVFGLDENKLGLYLADEPIAFVSNDINSDDLIPNPFLGIAAAPPEEGDAVVYVAHKPDGNFSLEIWKITVDSGVGPSLGPLFAVKRELLDTLPTSTWDDAASAGTKGLGPLYDPEDGGLVFAVASRVFKWREGVGVVWKSVIGTDEPLRISSFVSNTKIENHLIGWADSSGDACLIDTRDGTVIISALDGDTINPSWNPTGEGVFDGPTQSVIYMGSGSPPGYVGQFFLNRASGLGETIATVVEDISQRVGLDIIDLDTTDLTDTVAGYVIARQVTARKALEPLASAFLFDGVESDDKIKFIARGKDPVLTITESQLVSVGENEEILPEQRIQEVELPERFNVSYLDKATDYQQGVQSIKRIRQPVTAMNSRAEATLSLPMALTSSEAKQIAEKQLFTIWNERTAYKLATSWEFLKLDPSDVINITLGSGVSLRSRISRIGIGGDLSLDIEGIREDKTTFSSTASSDGSLGFPQKLPPQGEFTQVFLLNIPLLRDVDDTNQGSSRFYYAMGGFVDGWRSGNLFQSLDGGTLYNNLDRVTAGMTYGTIVNTLPDPGTEVFQIDRVNQLEVALQTGTLSSVTAAQFLNDENVCLVGSPSSQNWEIVGFQDAVLQSNGNYLLSILLRGKRGTEINVASHTTGERFILVRRDLINAFLLSLGQIGTSLLYKPLGAGSILESETPIPFTGLGNDLKPYAVAHLTATLEVDDDIRLDWVRRTRVGGDLVGGTGTIPLSEATESYEVDVKDGLGGSVLRLLLSTSPTVTYTKAQQDVDFLSQAGTRLLAVKFDGVDGATAAVDIGPSARALTFVGNAQLDDAIPTGGTKILGLKFDGGDGDTTTQDFSYANRSGTFVGNAQLDIAQSKFGSSSLLLDGTGDYISLPDHADWQFVASEEFTIHCWVRFSNFTTNHLIVWQGDVTVNDESFFLRMSTTGFLTWDFTLNGTTRTTLSADVSPVIDTWYHVAVTRDSGGVHRVFWDGVQKLTTTNSSALFDSASALIIGGSTVGGQDFAGHIDEFEIIKGRALWTANFTPPPIGVQDMDTALLLDGTGDRVTAPDSDDWTLAGEFSIQAWIRPTIASTLRTIVSSWKSDGSDDRSWVCRLSTGNVLEFVYSLDGTAITTLSSVGTVPTDGRWTHVAVTRDSSNDIRLFINGIEDISGGAHTQAATFHNAVGIELQIGALNTTAADQWTGHIDELEIVSGAALWTTDFFPDQNGLSEVALDAIAFEVFQISGAVGRGFGREIATIL